MKKIAIMFVFVLMIASVFGEVGRIWTTLDDCGDERQNVNHYEIGEAVFINGDGFNEGVHEWEIKGQPGQASCDPGDIVVSDNQVVNETGRFCFLAYIVKEDDCGEYKVDFSGKKDNFRVGKQETEVPEFSLITLSLATLVAGLGIVYLRRK